jgi:hypothetical protein
VAVLQPGDTALAIDAYLLFLGALAVSVLARVTRESVGTADSELERRVRPRRFNRFHRSPERTQLPELARVERELSLASVGAFDVHVRLRPTLREVAEYRLLRSYGVGLDEQPRRARELLGDEVWEIVRAYRELPSDRHAPGLSRGELERIVATLERL